MAPTSGNNNSEFTLLTNSKNIVFLVLELIRGFQSDQNLNHLNTERKGKCPGIMKKEICT